MRPQNTLERILPKGIFLGIAAALAPSQAEATQISSDYHSTYADTIRAVLYGESIGEVPVQLRHFELPDPLFERHSFIYGNNETHLPGKTPSHHEQYMAEVTWSHPSYQYEVGQVALHTLIPVNPAYGGDWTGVKVFATEYDIRQLSFELHADIAPGYAFEVVHNVNSVDTLVYQTTQSLNEPVTLNLGDTPGSNYVNFRMRNTTPEPSALALLGFGFSLFLKRRNRADFNVNN